MAHEFCLDRVFAVPLETLWAAWTVPAHLARWWGPKGFQMLNCEMDLQAGGLFFYGMKSPDGVAMYGKWDFESIISLNFLAFMASFSNSDKGVSRHPLAANWPEYVYSTMAFQSETQQSCRLSMTALPHKASQAECDLFQSARTGMEQGWAGTFSVLEAYLKSNPLPGGDDPSRVLVQQRSLHHPPARVFAEWTHRGALDAWWGPSGFQTTTKTIAFCPGGKWVYDMVGPDGTLYPNRVQYAEILPSHRLTYHHDTGVDADPSGFDVQVTFEPSPDGTLLTMSLVFADARSCDAAKSFGAMELGATTLAKLAARLDAASGV